MNKLFEYDKKIITNNNIKYICGIDEVGRGCLAGPVFATAIIMNYENLIDEINDSKKLSKKNREKLYNLILNNVVEYKTEKIDVDIIENINILNATKLCMINAVKSLKLTPDVILVDHVDIGLNSKPITHGDSISYAIACASIVAKVERDRYMTSESRKFPNYFFEKNYGYGTKQHIDAINKFGICKIHRLSFLSKIMSSKN